jgi:hypothetical protein
MTHVKPLTELDVSKLTPASQEAYFAFGAYILKRTAYAWTIVNEGEPLFAIGVEKRAAFNLPRVWMLVYEAAKTIPVHSLREIRRSFRFLLALYPRFECTVDKRDTVAVRFASFFGLRQSGEFDNFYIYEV